MSPGPTPCEILARILRERGVRAAFGMPGGEVLPLVAALGAEGIELVLVRHEGSAGFMADAAWQLTGAPGVAVATLGPGATNLVSGMAGALLDRSAVLAITGDVEHGLGNVYTHQVLDQRALYAPVSRASITLTAREAWREIPLVLRRLSEGRPGPVHLNLPADVATTPQPGFFEDCFSPAPALPPVASINLAADAIARAQRPLLLVGPADRSPEAARALRRLQRASGGPGLASYRAKGLLDERDPLYCGCFGLSPVVDRHQQALLAEADLLVLVGFDAADLRSSWLPGWPARLPAVVLDAALPTDLLHPAAHLLLGPLPALLGGLAEALEGSRGRPTWTTEALSAHQRAIQAPFQDGPLGPATALRALQSALPEDAIVALDVGAHRITACHTWISRQPGLLLQSNGLASMGYGLPAALAAAILRPERRAVAITGDMGLWMALGELGIAAERGLDLLVAYIADESLSLIELKQERMRLPNAGVRFRNPAVGPLAEAFGGVGRTVEGPEAIAREAREALTRGGLTLLEIRCDAGAYRSQM